MIRPKHCNIVGSVEELKNFFYKEMECLGYWLDEVDKELGHTDITCLIPNCNSVDNIKDFSNITNYCDISFSRSEHVFFLPDDHDKAVEFVEEQMRIAREYFGKYFEIKHNYDVCAIYSEGDVVMFKGVKMVYFRVEGQLVWIVDPHNQ